MCICPCVGIYAHVCIYSHVYVPVYPCVNVCAHVCVCVCVPLCMLWACTGPEVNTRMSSTMTPPPSVRKGLLLNLELSGLSWLVSTPLGSASLCSSLFHCPAQCQGFRHTPPCPNFMWVLGNQIWILLLTLQVPCPRSLSQPELWVLNGNFPFLQVAISSKTLSMLQ